MHIGKALVFEPSALKNGSSSLNSTIAPGRMMNSRPRLTTRASRVPVLRARQ
jgi:hypothetical protein